MNQKLSFFLGPGGLTAALFFGVKSLTGAEVFRFAAKPLQLGPVPALPADWRYVQLRTSADLAALGPGFRAQLGRQSGAGPERLFQRGASLHALLCGEAVVAQLNIESSPVCEVDDPKLALQLAEGDGFVARVFQRIVRKLVVGELELLQAQGIDRVGGQPGQHLGQAH